MTPPPLTQSPVGDSALSPLAVGMKGLLSGSDWEEIVIGAFSLSLKQTVIYVILGVCRRNDVGLVSTIIGFISSPEGRRGRDNYRVKAPLEISVYYAL